jgi:cytochrome c-type biogenesis protein CcmH
VIAASSVAVGSHRRPSGAALLVLFALLAGATALTVVGVRGHHVVLNQEQQAHQIAAGLRCPVCRDLSAADSPAPLAREMRQQIGQRLRAGQSPEAIRQGFVAAYGETVLMSPPHRGPGRVAYALPLLVVGGGMIAGALLLRRWRRRPAQEPAAAPPLSSADRRRVDLALSDWREEEGT